jgi:hypothetical protein
MPKWKRRVLKYSGGKTFYEYETIEGRPDENDTNGSIENEVELRGPNGDSSRGINDVDVAGSSIIHQSAEELPKKRGRPPKQ